MQSLGILAIFILFCGLLFLILKWPQGKHVTFSGHAARYKHTIIYYNLLFSFALPLLIIFFATWFVPVYHLSVYFLVFLVAASILQYIVTLIPRVGGRKTSYHDLLASLSALLLIPPMLFIIFSQTISLPGRGMAVIGLLVMLVLIGIALMNRREHKYFLLLQSGYFAAFFGAILAATYL